MRDPISKVLRYNVHSPENSDIVALALLWLYFDMFYCLLQFLRRQTEIH